MKRYFFNFFDGVHWSDDKTGQMLGSLKEVRDEARYSLVELSGDYCLLDDGFTLMFDVLDEAGQSVYKVELSLSEEASLSVG